MKSGDAIEVEFKKATDEFNKINEGLWKIQEEGNEEIKSFIEELLEY